MRNVLIILLLVVIRSMDAQVTYEFPLVRMSDEQYPDNPDIGYYASNYDHLYFGLTGSLTRLDNGNYNLTLPTQSDGQVAFNNIDLRSWIPTCPQHLLADDYLTSIAIINQEWNRNQVALRSAPMSTSDTTIVRVDLARNCLNAYLWEVIAYVEEDGKEVPFAHTWFDFPPTEYAYLFDQVNDRDFNSIAESLVEWKDPISQVVDKALLRGVEKKHPTMYKDLSDYAYPLAGARAKKRKEIVTPTSFETMRDLQSDQTTFATFAKPGMYTRSDPRITQLGRLQELTDAVVRTTTTPTKESATEIELEFIDPATGRKTHLILGGLDLTTMPVHTTEACNSGWKSSMGFGNHTFYETYDQHETHDASASPYYAYFTDDDGKWLDSHTIGVDGPLIHWGPEGQLHIWLLSFERHALVGHYALNW